MNTVVFIIACVAGLVATLYVAYKLGRRVGRVAKRRLLQKRNRKSMRWLILICLLLPSGCVVGISEVAGLASTGASGIGAWFDYKSAQKGKPVIVTPPLVDYSDAVQDRAADELEALQPPCSRDVIVGDCSVAARMILDYATLREKYGGDCR